VFKYAGVVAVALGVVRFAAPRVSVSSGTPRVEDDPLTTPFFVRNEGYLPIRKVGLGCLLNQAILEKSAMIMGSPTVFKDLKAPVTLPPGDATTTYCSPVPANTSVEWIYLDITVLVTFHATWLRPEQYKFFRFIGERWESGFSWEPRGLNEPVGPRGAEKEQRWLQSIVDSVNKAEWLESFLDEAQHQGVTPDAARISPPKP
jgi:hypothetical protein